MDIRQAYHNIPVAPADRYLLGSRWQQSLYIDQVLPFGLRSADSILSAVADALLWIMPKRGVSRAIHYIDDFLTIGRRDSQKCMCNIALMQRIYDKAGLPIEPSKSVGPATTLVFLGIEIDSVREELRLPEDKLMQLKEALSHWRGLLSHAAKVVKAGRTFLRRIIDLSTSASQLHHFIRLNTEARSDIEWWFRFISLWNRI